MPDKDEVKSALEIALEKIKNTDISSDNFQESDNIELGKKLGGKLLRDKDFDIFSVLRSENETDRKHITEGIEFILLANVILPQTPRSADENRVALEAIAKFKKNNPAILEARTQINQLFTDYQHAKDKTISDMKSQFEYQLKNSHTANSKEADLPPGNDTEKLTQFQQQLLNQLRQLNIQYEEALIELKNHLRSHR